MFQDCSFPSVFTSKYYGGGAAKDAFLEFVKRLGSTYAASHPLKSFSHNYGGSLWKGTGFSTKDLLVSGESGHPPRVVAEAEKPGEGC